MIAKLIKGAVVLLLTPAVAAWALTPGKSLPQAPNYGNKIVHWYL